MNFRLYNIAIILFFLLSNINVSAQQSNSCGVIARMTPAGDSILHTSSRMTFQSTSINATEYMFFVNGLYYRSDRELDFTFPVGLSKISLVAKNGNCTDTISYYYFYAGTMSSDTTNQRMVYGYSGRTHALNKISTLSSGGNLINGNRVNYNFGPVYEYQTGLLIKTTPNGCVEWAKKFPLKFTQTDIIVAKEGLNGSIFIVSSNHLNSPSTLMKLKPDGNIDWGRRILDSATRYDEITQAEPTRDGGVIAVSRSFPHYSTKLTRFDRYGTVMWQKRTDLNVSKVRYPELLIKDSYVYFQGNVSYSNFNKVDCFVTKIDINNGHTVWLKVFRNHNNSASSSQIISVDSTILISLTGSTGEPNHPSLGGIMRLDTAGNILFSKVIYGDYIPNPVYGPYFGIPSSLTRSGNNVYMISSGGNSLSLQGDGRSSTLISFTKDYELKWAFRMGGVNQPRFPLCTSLPSGGVTLGGISYSYSLLSNHIGNLMTIVKVDSLGGTPGAPCTYTKSNFGIMDYPLTVINFEWSIDEEGNRLVEPNVIPWENFYPEMRYQCSDYVDSCSYIKISGLYSICNLSQEYTYKSHRNKGCGQIPQWVVSSNMQMISQTDSSLTVKFNSFGRHVIYANNFRGCVPNQDSIVIIAKSTSLRLDLGSDRTICAGMRDTLHAGPSFFNYVWQDGSRDSILIINQPGQYWVKLNDSCNNILSDTLKVTLTPSHPFSAGEDLAMCEKDTLLINATPGFYNYQWSPAYQLSSLGQSSVKASPLRDTTYFVKAEQEPGCYVYDTIKIKVFHSSPINLGVDKSICLKDSVILNAGSGFASYTWNTGELTRQIIAKTAGPYIVKAKTVFGCNSTDTFYITNVFPLPKPRISGNDYLCIGTSSTLNATGNFSSYLWNNGNDSAKINVSATGLYVVKVTDINGCKGSDSFSLSTIKPNPQSFLQNELVFCAYEIPLVKSLKSFSNYKWNTGSSLSFIEIREPGIYWLEVKDEFGCEGRDSINMKIKNDCINGIYVPSAFTPDQNGINDVFKPLVYGKLELYDFKVYNRYGKMVFTSVNPDLGWNGKLQGVTQNGNAFVWTLKYKLEGEQIKFIKGSVLILR